MTTLKGQVQMCGKAQIGLLIGAAGIAAMFYLVGYRPQAHKLDELNNLITDHERQLDDAQGQAKDLPSEARAVDLLKARLANFQQLPPQPELGPFMRDVTQVSQQSDLRKLTVKPGVPRRDELYCELPVTLEFEGDFLNVFAFLHQVEQMARLTRVTAMQIHCSDPKHGQVQTTVQMNIYYSEG
jgi:Tfp pilus assembly protein PilO